MGNGIEAVVPGDMRSEYKLLELLQIPTKAGKVEGEKPLLKRLSEDAVRFLKDVGKNMPYATVEVRDNEVVVLHGVAECGEQAVCDLKGNDYF